MGARPPLTSSKKAAAALDRLGFEATHTNGSHCTYRRGHAVCVLQLGKTELNRHTLASTLRQAGLTVEEFEQALRQ